MNRELILSAIASKNVDVKKMFDFVIRKNYDEFVSLPELRKDVSFYLTKNLNSLNKKNIQQIEQFTIHLKAFNFFDRSNYEAFDRIDYTTMNILSNFKDELINQIEYTYLDTNKERKLERLVSPPLEAYEFVGHNKINITSSKESFGLLFE
jgi:hypothetical protein